MANEARQSAKTAKFAMSSPPARKRPSVSSMTMVEGVVIEDTSAPPPPPSLMAAQGLPRRRSAPSADGGIAFTNDGPGEAYSRPKASLDMHGNTTAATAWEPPAPVIAPRAPLQFGAIAATAVNVDKAKQGLQAAHSGRKHFPRPASPNHGTVLFPQES